MPGGCCGGPTCTLQPPLTRSIRGRWDAAGAKITAATRTSLRKRVDLMKAEPAPPLRPTGPETD
jgi:hypothetical protein